MFTIILDKKNLSDVSICHSIGGMCHFICKFSLVEIILHIPESEKDDELSTHELNNKKIFSHFNLKVSNKDISELENEKTLYFTDDKSLDLAGWIKSQNLSSKLLVMKIILFLITGAAASGITLLLYPLDKTGIAISLLGTLAFYKLFSPKVYKALIK